jgi:hypothetical protein
VGLVRYGAQHLSEAASRTETSVVTRIQDEAEPTLATKNGFWSWLRAAF